MCILTIVLQSNTLPPTDSNVSAPLRKKHVTYSSTEESATEELAYSIDNYRNSK